jgi:hypothetical protein
MTANNGYKREGSPMLNHMNESRARTGRFAAELPGAKPARREMLLRVWKKQILDQCAEVLKITDDVRCLSNIDRAIALSLDVIEAESDA